MTTSYIVVEQMKKEIEKLNQICSDLENKVAGMNVEKFNLVQFKETVPYVLREALKFVIFKSLILRF